MTGGRWLITLAPGDAAVPVRSVVLDLDAATAVFDGIAQVFPLHAHSPVTIGEPLLVDVAEPPRWVRLGVVEAAALLHAKGTQVIEGRPGGEEPEPTPGELVTEFQAGRITEDELLTSIMTLPRPEQIALGETAWADHHPLNVTPTLRLQYDFTAGRIERGLYDRVVRASMLSPIAIAREYEERVQRGEIDATRPGVIQWAIDRMLSREVW